MANGSIVGTRTLVDNGDPARRFDIVILGDGFQQAQLKRFDDKAAALAQGLLGMPPFDDVAHLINVHTVRTVSTDSGVSRFPTKSVKKKTFYNVTGHFQAPGLTQPPKSFLGTPTPEVILNAASGIAPQKDLDLYLVLVNVKALAASAFPEQQMAFTGLHQTNTDLVNYTAHECCHAIARTAEEYQDCDGPTPGKTFPNQATEADRLAGNVSWLGQAKASELNAAGDFRAVHLFGDPNVHFDATHAPVFDATPSLNGKLGLYWGCQDIDETLPGSCDFFQDSRGKGYYRPMATCRMRRVDAPFCRVCSQLMIDRIRAAAL
jgi:hypothetical protein